MQHPASELSDITVRYGDVVALANVSASFTPGQIHAVVGQNGAGKTTFARVASGIVSPSNGQVQIDGKVLPSGDVIKARRAGVGLVHQSFALPQSFSVAEAMEFGADRPGQFFSRKGISERWSDHLGTLGLRINPAMRIRDLPIETQQGVEIARALVNETRVLILDEPTAVLSPSGIETLFDRVRSLKAQGVTVLMILHKIREVLAVADTVTVLRAGKLIAMGQDCTTLDQAALSSLIIGEAQEASSSELESDEGRQSTPSGQPVLRLSGYGTVEDNDGVALIDADLTLAPGEILGVAGIEGNGQRSLVRALAGLAGNATGQIELAGRNVTQISQVDRRSLGLRIIPFERNIEGLSLTSSLWENWSIGRLLQGRLLQFVNPAGLRTNCDAALKHWDVRYNSCRQEAGSLSGGNAQKVILAREIDADARVIVAAQPTRGLDIGATEFVWQSLRQARDDGAAIILISSDLDELFDISDRIAVMLGGRIAGMFDKPFQLSEIGDAMIGAAA